MNVESRKGTKKYSYIFPAKQELKITPCFLRVLRGESYAFLTPLYWLDNGDN